MQKTQSLKHDCLHLAVLVAVALAIGVYLIVTSVIIAHDGVFYIEQAQNLALDPLGVARRYPVGYPALLFSAHRVAGLFTEGDSTNVWVYSSQAVTLLCRIVALVPLYLLGRLLVGGRRSFWAVLILVVLPHPAHYGSDVLREWPFLLFLALGFWLLIGALRDKRWWLFGLIGLAAGLGYVIRPMCGQLVIYGLLGLVVAFLNRQRSGKLAIPGAMLLLVVGFAIPVAPHLAWTGSAVSHPFFGRPSSNSAPVITAVGGRSASGEPLEFDVRPGASFEVVIEAFDPDGDALTFSVVAIPPGTRPVYRLWSQEHRADFWTMAEGEKDQLATSRRRVWDYKGIDYYAYPRAGSRSGLAPVYRFWSPVPSRHYYTIDSAEHPPAGQWQSEGVAFYAWPEGRAPSGAIPVYRFSGDPDQHFWALDDQAEAMALHAGCEVEAEGIAWYAHAAAEAPAGLTLAGGSLRWRPASSQQGEYQLNVIASDTELQSCQLVRIVVGDTGEREEANREKQPAKPLWNEPPEDAKEPTSPERGRRLVMALHAMDAVFDGISEQLIVFFLVPLCVGFGYRLRYEAPLQERVLMIAVVAVNAGLMFGRYMWIKPQSVGRYSVGLIALSICYAPTGLEVMARWLRTRADRVFGDRWRPEVGDRIWFYILLAIGVAICLPKLLRPMHADGGGYRDVAAWLRDHTEAEDVIAAPDRRIGFYAERQARVYQHQPDPRRADYVVTFVTGERPNDAPEGWEERYSCWLHEQRGKRLVVYQIR